MELARKYLDEAKLRCIVEVKSAIDLSPELHTRWLEFVETSTGFEEVEKPSKENNIKRVVEKVPGMLFEYSERVGSPWYDSEVNSLTYYC